MAELLAFDCIWNFLENISLFWNSSLQIFSLETKNPVPKRNFDQPKSFSNVRFSTFTAIDISGQQLLHTFAPVLSSKLRFSVKSDFLTSHQWLQSNFPSPTLTASSNVIIVGNINIENEFSLTFFETRLVPILTTSSVDGTKNTFYYKPAKTTSTAQCCFRNKVKTQDNAKNNDYGGLF